MSGLLLSTPVETIPILVTFSAVSGGIFFYAPPLDPSPSASSLPRGHSRAETAAAAGVASSSHDAEGGTAVDGRRRHPVEESQEGAAAAAAQVEEEEAEEEAAVFLDDAFPGKLSAAPVSLRSTATWEGRVQGMESSGPLVRATLTRTDVPGVMTGGGFPPGADSGIVRVSNNLFWELWEYRLCWAGMMRLLLVPLSCVDEVAKEGVCDIFFLLHHLKVCRYNQKTMSPVLLKRRNFSTPSPPGGASGIRRRQGLRRF